jgi:hypothetical protein
MWMRTKTRRKTADREQSWIYRGGDAVGVEGETAQYLYMTVGTPLPSH